MTSAPISLHTTAITKFEQEPRGILLSPDNQHLVSFRLAEIAVRLMADPAVVLYTLKTPSGIIQDLAFSPDGRLLAAATDDSQVALWSFPSGDRKRVVDGRLHKQGFFKGMFGLNHNQVVFSPDGKYMAALDNNSRPVIWETAKYSVCSQMDEQVSDAGVSLMDFSPDSQLLVVAHPHATMLYHSHLGIKVESFRAAGKCLAFHHSKKQFAVGLRDRVKLFDPNIEEAEFCNRAADGVSYISQVMFSGNGHYLLAAGRSVGASAKSDKLYSWALSNRQFIPLIYPREISTDSLYKLHFIGLDKLALVFKTLKQIVIMHLAFPH